MESLKVGDIIYTKSFESLVNKYPTRCLRGKQTEIYINKAWLSCARFKNICGRKYKCVREKIVEGSTYYYFKILSDPGIIRFEDCCSEIIYFDQEALDILIEMPSRLKIH